MYGKKLKKIEVALLAALALTLLWGIWSLREQDVLERKMIRLHVIANSDDEEDQALKLSVRDEILTEAERLLAASADITEAKAQLEAALPHMEQLARQRITAEGYDYSVSAELEQAEFPTKEYERFTLPAGEYLALRVVIGEGRGQNWWCVVFPPLCMSAADEWEDTAISAGLGRGDLSLITEENHGYVLKLRSLELWEGFRQWLNKRG